MIKQSCEDYQTTAVPVLNLGNINEDNYMIPKRYEAKDLKQYNKTSNDE